MRPKITLGSTLVVALVGARLVLGAGAQGSPAGSWTGHATILGQGDAATSLAVSQADEGDDGASRPAVAFSLRLPSGQVDVTATGRLAGNVLAFDGDAARTGFTQALGPGGARKSSPFHAEFSYAQDDSGETLDGHFSMDGLEGHETLRRSGTGWAEKYMGGSKAAEERTIAGIVSRISALQDETAAGQPITRRALHNKGKGLKARFEVLPSIAPDLEVGLFRAGASYDAIVRFSNAQGVDVADWKPDQRGVAVRVKTGQSRKLLSGATGDAQDFLFTNSPITARDPVEFVDDAHALTHVTDPSALLAVFQKYGIREGLYGLAHVGKNTDFLKESYTDEKLWSSRAPIKWGPLAVKLQMSTASPATASDAASDAAEHLEEIPTIGKRDHLWDNLAARLKQGDITLDFSIQRFESEQTTPIEDGSVEWKTKVEPVARLVLTKQDLSDDEAKALQKEIETMAFSPWNCTEDFRPLGSLMRARLSVYATSAARRGGCPFGFGK